MSQSRLRLSGNKLPVILQAEAAECGLACVAMIAAYHGHHIGLSEIRRRFSVSIKGATLKSIMAIAGAMRLATRPVKLDMRHLGQLKLPALLHWNFNHFVALKKIGAGVATIHDPAVGERTISLSEFSKHFTGVAVEFSPESNFEPRAADPTPSIRSLMGRVVGLGRGLAQILILAVALEVAAIMAPFYMQWLVDHALLARDVDLVTTLGIGFLMLVCFQTAVGAFRSWVVADLSINLNYQWQINAFSHLLRLPMDYFEKRHLGDINSKFGSIASVQKTLTTSFIQSVIDGLLVVGTLAMMLWYSPKLALIACIASAIYGLQRMALFRGLRGVTAEHIIQSANQQTHFLETVRGVQSIRLFGREADRRTGWGNLLVEQFNSESKIQRFNIWNQASCTLLFGIERVVIIWLAAYAVIDGIFSIGMLFAFIAYKDQFASRVAALIDKLAELRMARLHGERIADIVFSPKEENSPEGISETELIDGDITVSGVSFAYSQGDQAVLKNVNMTIRKGESVAITGASGCGKSTLMKIILGLLRPSEGAVSIGGRNIQRIGLDQFRAIVGSVMQEDTLFTGSIAENITFFDPSPDLAWMNECAQAAACHQEIISMPMGFSTLVGDIGSGLSGGQRQRILLARALYKRPDVLVLDEATSQLDVTNERAVNASISAMKLTRIVVAHRPETIASADRVFVLHQGTVVKEFSPKQVVADAAAAAVQNTT